MKFTSAGQLKSIFIMLVTTTTLVACGGNGSSGDSASNDIINSDNTTGTPLVISQTPGLKIETSVLGDRVPGQKVSLVPAGETEKVLSIEWQQTGGPSVNLEQSDNNISRFRIPAVDHDTSFSFRLVARDNDGHEHYRHIHVEVKALNWKYLKVVEPVVNGNTVVFRANKDNNLRVDLYRAGLDGADIVRLNGPLTPGGNVHSFSISPDGTKVAYLADEDSSGVFELFVVDAGGGDSIKVSGDLVAGGNVTADFQWSPDSSKVAFRADKNTDEVFELFAASAGAADVYRLSGEMTLNGDVAEADFFWSDDSQYIAYRANQFNDNALELFVSSSDGVSNQRVSSAPVVNGGVLGNFAWMPGATRLAYIGDQQEAGVFELYSVNHDGAEHVKVSGPIASGGSVLDFKWSLATGKIAYRAEQLVDEVVELYSVNSDASDNTLISAVPLTGDVGSYEWNMDASAIAFIADQDTDDVFELYVAGADGANNTRVSAPQTSDGDVLDFAWSPDAAYLAYRAVIDGSNDNELFSVAPDGSANLRVSGDMPFGGDVLSDWRWTQDSSRLVYRADQRANNEFELFSAAPDGSSNLLISSSMVVGGDVDSPEGDSFQISADSSRVVYSADQIEDEQYELFVTSPDSGLAISSISGPLTSGGDVRNFALANLPASLSGLSGVQTNLPQDALLGWELCFSNLYADADVDSITSILSSCHKENLMMACRPVGASVLTVAAWGPRAAVTADTAQTNVTNRANDVEWYFNDDWSWGFASAGDEVERITCDIRSEKAEQRLCWHTDNGFLNGGYRCGATEGLNGSTDWERLMYHRTP